MRAFAENESLAMQLVVRLGYDPLKASQGLIGLSNTYDTHGQDKRAHMKEIAEALKITL
jgi:hypothetical protein